MRRNAAEAARAPASRWRSGLAERSAVDCRSMHADPAALQDRRDRPAAGPRHRRLRSLVLARARRRASSSSCTARSTSRTTGSPATTAWSSPARRARWCEPEPWMDDAAAFVRRAADAGVPVLGVCFGHQLVGYALRRPRAHEPQRLGGRHRRGRAHRRGPRAIRCSTGCRARLRVNQSHRDEVGDARRGTRAPGRGRAHADTRRSPSATHVRGVQFHPEMNGRSSGASSRTAAASSPTTPRAARAPTTASTDRSRRAADTPDAERVLPTSSTTSSAPPRRLREAPRRASRRSLDARAVDASSTRARPTSARSRGPRSELGRRRATSVTSRSRTALARQSEPDVEAELGVEAELAVHVLRRVVGARDQVDQVGARAPARARPCRCTSVRPTPRRRASGSVPTEKMLTPRRGAIASPTVPTTRPSRSATNTSRAPQLALVRASSRRSPSTPTARTTPPRGSCGPSRRRTASQRRLVGHALELHARRARLASSGPSSVMASSRSRTKPRRRSSGASASGTSAPSSVSCRWRAPTARSGAASALERLVERRPRAAARAAPGWRRRRAGRPPGGSPARRRRRSTSAPASASASSASEMRSATDDAAASTAAILGARASRRQVCACRRASPFARRVAGRRQRGRPNHA